MIVGHPQIKERNPQAQHKDVTVFHLDHRHQTAPNPNKAQGNHNAAGRQAGDSGQKPNQIKHRIKNVFGDKQRE